MSFVETRGMLAKLLATENLIVEHDAQADTASFNTQTRVLKLPVLSTNSEQVYNLFVAHEVGHALETPVDWREHLSEDVPFDYVNVIEDVRIEKFIQSKYPGLRRDFSNGYTQLSDDDFFEIGDKDPAKFNFIDRINLHFKLGARALIPFTSEEMVYVTAVDEADTFDKVCLVAKMIQQFIKSRKQNKAESQDLCEAQSGGSQQAQEVEANEDGEGEDQQPQMESTTAETGTEANEEESQTQRAFDKNTKDLLDNNKTSKYVYVTNPKVDFEQIVECDELRADFKRSQEYHNFDLYSLDVEYNKFMNSIKRDVSFMAQQFEMRKSADAYARQQIHKTGVLNTNILHNYMLSDDLFLRQTVVPDGKNHGMVMLLDWSGSMDNICHSTVKQILTLVQFCRKVSIPFEVYTFTNGHGEKQQIDKVITHEMVGLVNVLSSSAKRRDLEQDMKNIFSQSMRISHRHYHVPYSDALQMSGTPLNNCLFMMPDVIERFKRRSNVQKVSFVCITDGESSPVHYTLEGNYGFHTHALWYDNLMVRHSDGRVTKVAAIDGTAGVVRWLRQASPDTSISHIFLGGYATCRNYVQSYGGSVPSQARFTKDSGCVVPTSSWPSIACVSPRAFGEAQEEISVDAGAKKGEIRTALRKYLRSHSSCRVILGGLVEQFA